MSKIQELFTIVNETKPNSYSDSIKLRWINTVEGFISDQIHKIAFEPYVLPEDNNVQLLVLPPYDTIYEHYLKAMIDHADKSYEDYNNNIMLYDAAFSNYAKSYIRNCVPATEYTAIIDTPIQYYFTLSPTYMRDVSVTRRTVKIKTATAELNVVDTYYISGTAGAYQLFTVLTGGTAITFTSNIGFIFYEVMAGVSAIPTVISNIW